MINSAERLIKIDEGCRLKVYKDIKEINTIGWGRNLDDVGITQSEADLLLHHDLANVIGGIAIAFPWFNYLSEVRQAVVINMVFNMGLPRFKLFKNTIRYIHSELWSHAAAEILDSKAARELPIRYNRLSQMMLTDKWPKES